MKKLFLILQISAILAASVFADASFFGKNTVKKGATVVFESGTTLDIRLTNLLGGSTGGGAGTWGSIGGSIAAQADLQALLAAKQPIDSDLTSLSGATGTNTLYYRFATGDWRPVTIGSGLDFVSGVLTGTGGSWGGIEGDITAQTDLQTALSLKQHTFTAGSGLSLLSNLLTVNKTFITDQLEDTTPTEDDFIPTYNTTGDQLQKVTLANFAAALDITTISDQVTGFQIQFDTSILTTNRNARFADGNSVTVLAASKAAGQFMTGINAGGILTFGYFDISSNAQITSDQNNYTPVSSTIYQRMNTDATRTITGWSESQVGGQFHTLVNVGVNNLILANENASSTASNRFHNSTGGDVTLAPNEALLMFYDATSSRWHVITFTTKAINPRSLDVNVPTSPVTPDIDSYDFIDYRAIGAALTVNAPTGTPAVGKSLILRFTDDGTSRALTFTTGSGGAFRASSDLAFPAGTTVNKTLYVKFLWNGTANRWDMVAKLDNF